MPKEIKTNCPFTLTEYRSLIRLAKKRFPFISFTDYLQYEKFVLWRHDVEYNVNEMNILAEINTEEGIKSTFFVQLHCIFYNFWDKINTGIFKNWLKWGHDIGLHFDCGYHDSVFDRMEELILKEKAILEDTLETAVHSFAYHNPNPKILKYSENYGGLINAYNKDFLGGNITYVSDSNGRWRENTLRDVLENTNIKKVQANLHDTWWNNQRIPQIKKLENALRENAEKQISIYKDTANIVVEDII
jgi:hypothetical protein